MKFEVSGKLGNALSEIAGTIEAKISYHKPMDVPIEWCNGSVKYLKKSVVYVHHGRIDKCRYD